MQQRWVNVVACILVRGARGHNPRRGEEIPPLFGLPDEYVELLIRQLCILGFASYRQRGRIIQQTSDGSRTFQMVCWNEFLRFASDINVNNGELGGRAINRYSCVSRRRYSLCATLSVKVTDEDGFSVPQHDDHDVITVREEPGLHLEPYQRDVTNVKRSGEWLNIESRNLVPRSLVRLTLGGLIPADCSVFHLSL